MNINSKYKKYIITTLLGTTLTISLSGCNNKDGLIGKYVPQKVKGESVSKQKISIEEASTILYERLDNSDFWWEHKGEQDNYYIFEETSVGTDFRYMVDMYTGEIFYESSDAIGEIIKLNKNSEIPQAGPKDIKLLNDIKPKLKSKEGLEQVKEQISSKVKNTIKKYGYNISDATETNDFVILDGEYEKYTQKYKQLMYYLMSNDYSTGISQLNFSFEQEIHAESKINKDDNFIKLIHEMYVYLTGNDVSIDKFTNSIAKLHESNTYPTELTDKYLGITFENENVGGSSRRLKMSYYSEITDTLKSKYYKKKFDTVAEYKKLSEEKSEEVKQFNEKTSYIFTREEANGIVERDSPNIGNNKDFMVDMYLTQKRYFIDAEFKYGKNKFMQTGQIYLTPRSLDYKISKSEVDSLHTLLKSILGDELYNKLDNSYLTEDYLNKSIRSARIKSKYEDTLPSRVLGHSFETSYPIEMNNASFNVNADNILIKFSIPVEAEGIREI